MLTAIIIHKCIDSIYLVYCTIYYSNETDLITYAIQLGVLFENKFILQ